MPESSSKIWNNAWKARSNDRWRDEARGGDSSVEKALDLLLHLAASGAVGVTALGRAVGLPKSTAHRLLAALGRRGLVERDTEGRYRPGMRLVALGLGVLDREPVVAAARGVLEAEAAALGETLFLAGARAGRLVVLDKVEGTGFLRAAPRVGEEVPAHATATGKLYLAFAPEELAGGEPPRRFTARTQLGRPLERELARVRRRGWAENREEWMPGLAVVAAPVRTARRMHGVVALAAPAVRLTRAERPRLAARMLEAAARIGARLEGSDA
jgi:DNA-binding IclR family transcriptional regulator